MKSLSLIPECSILWLLRASQLWQVPEFPVHLFPLGKFFRHLNSCLSIPGRNETSPCCILYEKTNLPWFFNEVKHLNPYSAILSPLFSLAFSISWLNHKHAVVDPRFGHWVFPFYGTMKMRCLRLNSPCQNKEPFQHWKIDSILCSAIRCKRWELCNLAFWLSQALISPSP